MSDWPELSVERDHETLAILHLASQMLGKIRVAHAPWMNHGWHVALQPNARGLSTLPTAAAAPPSARSAKAYETTTTRGAPGLSSAGSIRRPYRGVTRSALKKPDVTRPAPTRSGPPAPTIDTPASRTAPKAAKLRC